MTSAVISDLAESLTPILGNLKLTKKQRRYYEVRKQKELSTLQEKALEKKAPSLNPFIDSLGKLRKNSLKKDITKQALNDLSAYFSYLDSTVNNCTKYEQEYEELLQEWRVTLEPDHKFEAKLNPRYVAPDINENYIHNYLYKSNKEEYKVLKDQKRKITFVQNNIEWAEAYFSLFLENQVSIYLKHALNLLRSAAFTQVLNQANTKYQETVPYLSKNHFCSFSNYAKAKERELQVTKNLKLGKEKGYTHGFLTFTFKNTKAITKQDFKDIGTVIHRLWDVKISEEQVEAIKEQIPTWIKEVEKNKKLTLKQKKLHYYDLTKRLPIFLKKRPTLRGFFKGYYGVLEVKHNLETGFHPHIHLLVSRSKEYEDGYFSQYYLREVFRVACKRHGKEKFEDSFICNIVAPHLTHENKEKGAVRYIHKYITKGFEIKDKEKKKEIILATEGIRFFRSGGILALNGQKTLATAQEIEEKARIFWRNNFSVAPVFGSDHNPIKIDRFHLAFQAMLSRDEDDFVQNLCYKSKPNRLACPNRVKTDFFKKVQESLFSRNARVCPIFPHYLDNDVKRPRKLQFSGLRRSKRFTPIYSEFVIHSAIKGAGFQVAANNFHKLVFGICEHEADEIITEKFY